MSDFKSDFKSIRNYIILILILASAFMIGALLLNLDLNWNNSDDFNFNFDKAAKIFNERTKLLYSKIISDVGEDFKSASNAGYAAFLSLCDGKSRARVFTGTGKNLEKAYQNAVNAAENSIKIFKINPKWLKADVLISAQKISGEKLKREIKTSRREFFRNGLALDENFKAALLEAELNGARIYDYKNGGIDLNYLNNYLSKSGRELINKLPENYILFQTRGWFCDEQNAIYPLMYEGLDYGRREVKNLDDNYAREIIKNSTDFLLKQVKSDGSFIYGIWPRFDSEIKEYNILRHAGTTWALCLRYRLFPDDNLKNAIERCINYLISQIIYKNKNTAYILEAKSNEIKLGGCGIAVLALTEYMNIFKNIKYKDICEKLGGGILSMMDKNTGKYVHVLNRNFTLKDEYRTVFYDGEATFALVRLYTLTGDKIWLDAACSAVNNFIANDYIKYRDHWIAYSMNEITKYINKPEYWDFALKNAAENLDFIVSRDTTYHIFSELLLATFETYNSMIENKIKVKNFNLIEKNFDVKLLLLAIKKRMDMLLNGYFFPEYAMYMQNPDRILNSFMVRNSDYRVRIDDVQHNVGAYFLYYKNYNKLLKYGLGEVSKGDI